MKTNALINNKISPIDQSFTILCIDDKSVNLKVLASIFKDDYKIIVSKSAKQGLKKAIELLPDLILLDVLMPEENGFELIVKLKKNPALRHIPVIFITGLQSVDDEEKGFTLGACDYIQKPFHSGIVRARVSTQLEIVRQRKLLENIAHVDSLTELPNRRKWQMDSQKYWDNAKIEKTAIVCGILDVDHFKKYNDCYGHQQGDIALRKVSNCIKNIFLEVHGNIYRCGGEEFYFYIPNSQNIAIKTLLNRCIDNVFSLAIEHKQAEILPYLTVSIGAVLLTPTKNNNLENIIKTADEMLYKVKKTTRNSAHLLTITT